jgi:plasmid stability protein
VATQAEERTALSTWVPISQALELQARAARADRSVSAELRRALSRYLTSSQLDTGCLEARGLDDPGVDPRDEPTGANEAKLPAASGASRPTLPSIDNNPEESR